MSDRRQQSGFPRHELNYVIFSSAVFVHQRLWYDVYVTNPIACYTMAMARRRLLMCGAFLLVTRISAASGQPGLSLPEQVGLNTPSRLADGQTCAANTHGNCVGSLGPGRRSNPNECVLGDPNWKWGASSSVWVELEATGYDCSRL